MIQGHGNSKAEIMFIADGGYNDCVTTNYALGGYNERQIAQLAGNSFKVEEIYRTLLIKEKISYQSQDKEPYYKNKETVAKIEGYKDILLEEINTLNPNLIIPLGELTLKFLTNYDGIRKYRGSCLTVNPEFRFSHTIKALPTYGPHIWNTEYKQRWITKIDFEKVPNFRGSELPSEQRHSLWICRTYSAFKAFCDRHYREDGFLVFDIETFCGIPTCISFCFDGIESICIPFLDKEVDFDQRVLLIGGIGRLLASPIRKGNQNIKYDWKVLERFCFKVNNVVADPMLAASCLMPELPKNLGFLTSIYTDLPYFKDEGREFDPRIHSRERFYLYNAKDSLATWQINNEQQKEINDINSRYVYDNLVKLIPIYKTMENHGLWYDDEARQKLLAKYTTLYNIEVLKVNKLLNTITFNPASHQQCAKVVYEELEYSRTKEASATGEEELEWLMVFGHSKRSPIYGPLVLQSIINCRKIHKVIEYLNTLAYPDGKWRSEYNLAGTETGRSSAGVTTDVLLTVEETKKGWKTVVKQLGRSFQTIAKHGFRMNGELYGKDLRTMFVPTSGYSFVEVDLSQAEARVDAVLAGNYKILEIFDGPIGIHRLTGSWVYNCDPSEIKKETLEYLMSKTVRHAGERNMKFGRLVMMVQCTTAEAERVLKIFHAKQPEIKEVFHRDIRQAITNTRELIAPNGRRRQFLDRINEHTFNEGISYLPQSIVSDQTKFSLIPTTANLGYTSDNHIFNLINEAHDGTLAEVKYGHEEEYFLEYKKNIEIGIDFRKCSLPRDFELVIPCEVSVSKTNWLEMKGVKF